MREPQQAVTEVSLVDRKYTISDAFPLFAVGIAAFCALWSLAHVLRFGVSVPFWDEWDFINDVRRIDTGQTSWIQAILLRNGEHQLSIQVGLSTAGWYLTHMHLRAVMIWNWSLSVLFCLLAAKVTAREIPHSSTPWFALAAACFVVFNPAAYQTMLWALPPVYTLLSFVFLLGVYVAQSRLPVGIKIIAIAVLSLFVSFILANGLLFWIALPAVLILYEDSRRLLRRRLPLIIFGILLGLTIAGYIVGSQHYTRQTPDAKPGWHFLGIAEFFLAFTGNLVSLSLSPQPVQLAEVIGALAIVLFVLAAAVSLRLKGNTAHGRTAFIWVYFGVFWLLSGVSVAAGRYTFGVTYALEASRYVLASSFFVLATLVSVAIALRKLSDFLPHRLKLYSCLVSGVSILLFIGILCRYDQSEMANSVMEYSRYSELAGAVAVQSSDLLQLSSFHNVFPHSSFSDFQMEVKFLNAHTWIHPALWDQRFLRRLRDLTPNAQCGHLDSVFRTSETIHLEGWAYLPYRSQRAHAIIIAGLEDNSDPKILGVTFVTKQRPDVAAALHSPEALSTGWVADVPLALVGKHAYRVEAFAYDAETGRACKTAGGRPLT